MKLPARRLYVLPLDLPQILRSLRQSYTLSKALQVSLYKGDPGMELSSLHEMGLSGTPGTAATFAARSTLSLDTSAARCHVRVARGDILLFSPPLFSTSSVDRASFHNVARNVRSEHSLSCTLRLHAVWSIHYTAAHAGRLQARRDINPAPQHVDHLTSLQRHFLE